MRFAHTNIIAKDWRTLVEFYVKVFDCVIVPPIRDQKGDWLDRGVGVHKAELQGAHLKLPGHENGGPTLEIYQYSNLEEGNPNLPANATGIRHLAFEVEDVSAILEKLIQFGGEEVGTIVSKTVDGVGVITFVYARDIEENLIELQHWEYD